MAGRLTTTSFCLLGLLRLRPFSAYELTKYMQRSALSKLWPRTEAAIYREGNRLVDAGLARASTQSEGRRTRTIFEISPKGREAFQRWLAEPGGPLRFECEAAVKAFFGDALELDELRVQLMAIKEAARSEATRMEPAARDWLDGKIEFPERLHYTAMAADLIARIKRATDEWAIEWLDRTAAWEGTGLTPSSLEEARAKIADIREDAAKLAGTQ
jgi:PadR family transcriptional regulator, regulatory protein AphA